MTALISSTGQLANVSELVGKWNISTATAPIDGSAAYSGFIANLSNVFSAPSALKIQRLREAAIRALAACG